MHFYDLKAEDNKGETITFDRYRDRVVLIVNTATRCGYTPQYEGLQKLYESYHEEGFEILDFPCNQFLNQAPGSAEDIEAFCTLNYHAQFKQFKKIHVNGRKTHPVYQYLKEHKKGMIKWNFTKFLVDQKGTVIKRYASDVLPESIAEDVESLLSLKEQVC